MNHNAKLWHKRLAVVTGKLSLSIEAQKTSRRELLAFAKELTEVASEMEEASNLHRLVNDRVEGRA